jgi:hypothetical protein
MPWPTEPAVARVRSATFQKVCPAMAGGTMQPDQVQIDLPMIARLIVAQSPIAISFIRPGVSLDW